MSVAYLPRGGETEAANTTAVTVSRSPGQQMADTRLEPAHSLVIFDVLDGPINPLPPAYLCHFLTQEFQVSFKIEEEGTVSVLFLCHGSVGFVLSTS